jgi:hypothetical protein
VRILL